MIAELTGKVIDFFFGQNFPSLGEIMLWMPVLAIYMLIVLSIAVWLRTRLGWKVGYTRKFFHFMTFGMAGLMQYSIGIPGVFILGWVVTALLVYIIVQGAGNPFYAILARPTDAPFETKYIVYPYLATFLGGVLANLLFSPVAAVAGYLVAGIGDAAGEPVGTRWGKHKYKVPSWGSRLVSYRSVEGSIGVGIACVIAFALALSGAGMECPWPEIIIAAIGAAIVEAISPHGWDNLTAQLAGAALATVLLM